MNLARERHKDLEQQRCFTRTSQTTRLEKRDDEDELIDESSTFYVAFLSFRLGSKSKIKA